MQAPCTLREMLTYIQASVTKMLEGKIVAGTRDRKIELDTPLGVEGQELRITFIDPDWGQDANIILWDGGTFADGTDGDGTEHYIGSLTPVFGSQNDASPNNKKEVE